MSTAKEIEIIGCINVPEEVGSDEVIDTFIEYVESHGWFFGGGFRTIQDGYYINADGTKAEPVLGDYWYPH